MLNHASNQVNTLPSDHAAGAVAVALALGSLDIAVATLFVVLALMIAVATVVGRYHYTNDSVAGVLVAVLAWGIVGAAYGPIP